MTSTYDHRIIQGAESGRFLARIEEYLQGGDGFYEDVFASLGVEAGPPPAAAGPRRPPRRPPATAQATRPTGGEQLLQAVQAASTYRRARAQPRPPRRAPGSARHRAGGRPRP